MLSTVRIYLRPNPCPQVVYSLVGEPVLGLEFCKPSPGKELATERYRIEVMS